MAQVALAQFQFGVDSADFEAYQQQQLQRQIEQQQELQRQHQQLIQQQQQPQQPVLQTQPLFQQGPIQQVAQPVERFQQPVQPQVPLGASEPQSQGDEEIDISAVKGLLSKLLFAGKHLIDNLDEETLKSFLQE